MTAANLWPPKALTQRHELASFDCGVQSLNDWLRLRALSNNRSGASRTYVLTDNTVVIGYYCLSTGAIDREGAPGAIRRNMPDPIPVLVLGRLAVDRNFQNRGIGRALLRDAVFRALQVSELVGAAALLVHALSGDARRFYQSCGFIESPLQPMTLCLMLKTAREVTTVTTSN